MQRTKNWKWGVCVLLTIIAIGLLTGSPPLADHKGKPHGGGGGGGGDTSPPPPSYSITPLGTLGGTWSIVGGMNNYGDVVGQSKTDDLIPPDIHAFVSTTDADGNRLPMIDLNDLIDPASNLVLTGANGINDSGQIVGQGRKFDVNGVFVDFITFRFTPDLTGNGFAILDMLGDLGPAEINNSGDVVGTVNPWNVNGPQAFLWTAENGMLDLGTLQGAATQGLAITNRDTNGDVQIVVKSKGPGVFHAWRYDTATRVMQDLGTLRRDNSGGSEALDINDFGEIAGSANAGRHGTRPFRYSEFEGMVDLGGLGPGDKGGGCAFGINNLGDVVGVSDFRAFLYSNVFGMVNLEDLIIDLPEGLVGQVDPADINDVGEICGPLVTNFNRVSGRVAFVLTPLP